MPPIGAAKQHPTPTAQADTRRSSCPDTVCNREARRTRRVEGWGRQQCSRGMRWGLGRQRDRGRQEGRRGTGQGAGPEQGRGSRREGCPGTAVAVCGWDKRVGCVWRIRERGLAQCPPSASRPAQRKGSPPDALNTQPLPRFTFSTLPHRRHRIST